jgi:hypothetical protein
MSTIVTRAAKGSPLTHAEVDANFTNLNTDKYESGSAVTFSTLTVNSTSQFGRSSANYIQAIGAATTLSPEISVLGSDTNIPLTLESKGTGAVNLAPGSRGVNISNGGTVTAITRTAQGSGYTSIPTVIISSPTTAGGVQATGNVVIQNGTASPVNGGSGYVVGDVITVVGGTLLNATVGTFRVSAVSGGAITALDTPSFGQYSAVPTNPVSVTGGSGTNATLNVTYFFGYVLITNAGSGYVEQPTVTFSGGGGSGAAAYATVGSGTTVRSLNGVVSFNTPAGESFRISNSAFSTLTDYVEVQGGSNVNGAYLNVGGSTTNGNMYISAKGTGNVNFFTNGAGVTRQLQVSHTASAVNYVQVTGAATTGAPVISAQGSDTNIGLTLNSKGAGTLLFQTNGTTRASINSGATFTAGILASGNPAFIVSATASQVNYLQANGSATGNGLQLQALGSDTNIDLNITTKGTGAVKFNTGGGEQLRVSNTASAVNYVQVTGAATTGVPIISSQGSDTNIGIRLVSKGTGNIALTSGNNAWIQFVASGANSSVNYLQVSGNTATNAPVLSSQGSDTNIDLALTPKGTGRVQFGTRTATSDVAITGYLEIKDSGGTVRKLAIID